MLQEGIELLLRLVTDEGALPEVFDATLAFIGACREGVAHASLGYSFALLHHLGLLPDGEDLEQGASLTGTEHGYLRACCCGMFFAPVLECDIGRLFSLRAALLNEHLATPLKTANVVAAMI